MHFSLIGRSMSKDFFAPENHAANNSNYWRAGGPQQTSLAVKRRKIRVEIRARTLVGELSSDIRGSMADPPSLSHRFLHSPKPPSATVSSPKVKKSPPLLCFSR